MESSERALYGSKQRRNMAGNNLQGIVKCVAEAPRKHQVQDLVHLSCQHRTDRSGEHRQTLEDRPGVWSVLLPAG